MAIGDQDLIRRCVERAEGFDFHIDPEGWLWVQADDIRPSSTLTTHFWPYDEAPQAFYDALAAQLVRQVDAMEDYQVTTGMTFSSVLYYGTVEETTATGFDRTINTLRAIDEFYEGRDDG